jgi:hypothetical protein
MLENRLHPSCVVSIRLPVMNALLGLLVMESLSQANVS